jgi:hypothetical protein
MKRVRDFLNDKPWLGWAIAGVFLVVSIALYLSLSGRGDTYSVERMSEKVTLKCIETGDEWTMTRGLMERELRSRTGSLDSSQGIINPKTGRPTGFPFSKSEWEETIKRLNKEKEEPGGRTEGERRPRNPR